MYLDSVCNNKKENFLWRPEEINFKFHKLTKTYTWNFTCVFTNPMKIEIYFFGLSLEIVFGIITDNWL